MTSTIRGAVRYAQSRKTTLSSVTDRVVPVKEQGDDKYYTIKQKLQIAQQIDDQFAKLLSGSEQKVLCWVARNAAGWGVPCITEVVGIMIARDTGLSVRTIRRAIPALVDMGFLLYEATRNKWSTIWLNIVWEKGDPMLAQPKRLKNQPAAETEGKGQDDTYGWAISDNVAHEEEPNKHLPSVDVETIPSGGMDGWAGQVEETVAPLRKYSKENAAADMAKTKAKIAKNKDRQQKISDQYANADNLEPRWLDLLESHYPDLARPRWTATQKGIMRQIGKRWASANHVLTFFEFFDWSIANWPAVIRKQFGWMTKSPPPRAPDFRFWTAHYEAFYECFASGKLTKWMRAPDRERLEFLKARGMAHEEAIYELAREQARTDLQDQMRATRQAAADAERRAAENVKRVERLQQFGGTAPVHPKSDAAKKILGVQPVAPIPDGVDLDDLNADDIPAWEE